MCQIGNLCDDKAAVSCKCHRNMARQNGESGPKLMASFSSHWLKKYHHCQVFSKGLVGHIYERYRQNILLRGLDKVQEISYRLYDSG